MAVKRIFWVLPVLSGLLLGCGTQPSVRDTFDGSDAVSPQAVSSDTDRVARGSRLLWGGVIVAADNQSDRTILEVLGYPLDSAGRPDLDARSQGRFLIDRSGFLEPRDYAPGRAVTVAGPLLGYKDGTVAGSPYRYPAVAGEQLQLWPRRVSAYGERSQPRVGVGVGVGSHGSGVGVSVGF